MLRRSGIGAALVAVAIASACSRNGDVGTNGAVIAKAALDISGEGPGDSVRFGKIGFMNRQASVAVLPSGALAVADGRDKRILLFDRTGKLIHSQGRAGDGPGEYRTIGWIGRCGGDSLYVLDVGAARITVLDSTAKLVREFRMPVATWKIGCNDAGELITMASPVQAGYQPSADAPLLRSTVFMFSPTGDTIARIDSVPAGRNRPMAAITEIARTRDRVLIGTGDSALIETFSPSGSRLGVLRFSIPNRIPTQAEYDAWIDSVYLAPIPKGKQRDGLRKYVSGVPRPARAPGYKQMFVDSLGNAWAVPFWPLDTLQYLYGVAPIGSALQTIQLPSSVHVIEIGPDYIIGWRTDSDDVDHVVVYRFRRQ